MQSRVNPYLSFRDNARQAMEFYKSIFGGKLTISTFKDFGMAQDPADADKVMHAMLESDGITFMGSDTPPSMPFSEGARISMALSGDNAAELTGYFEKLAAGGGQVKMPLAQAPWGDSFGMLTDRFGIDWMVNIAGKKA